MQAYAPSLNTAAQAVAAWEAAEAAEAEAVAREEEEEVVVVEAAPELGAAVEIEPNPLCVRDDLTHIYEWRAVPITGSSERMSDDMRRITDEQGFEYASTTAGSQHSDNRQQNASSAISRGAVHLYRRKRTSVVRDEDAVYATLTSQLKILVLKRDIDALQVSIVTFRNKNPSSLG